MKGDYQKHLKKLTLLFLSNPVPFNGQSYKKQKGIGTSDQSLFRLRNKFKKISLLVIYYQTKFDGATQSGSWVIPKLKPAKLYKPIHDIINYSTSIFLFWIWKVWKGRGKITKIWISRERKEKIKIWKNKNLIKIADTRFNDLSDDLTTNVILSADGASLFSIVRNIVRLQLISTMT